MVIPTALPPLELWGGHECTVNRIGDHHQDQSRRTGHVSRLDDLDRFNSLGLSRLRYPILWETVSPDRPDQSDWRASDAALEKLLAVGLRPIAGLVHHGSGPRYTDLLAPDFATGLAAHAARVAQRYPWISDWTPVNEPLTTARFSTLYGHWYPHMRDERSFWLALLNQIDAIRLSMAAIRRIVPDARLIQTEDLGRTFSTAALAEQARFDNERRWATWDLLEGRLTDGHPLHPRLRDFGFGSRLDEIAAHPCPPDVIGINHYLTSDRFLDDALDRHPAEAHGGNGAIRYADVAAVRIAGCGDGGLTGALRETWARYGRPVAFTEIHNGCTREEQMRWLDDAWSCAMQAREEGVEVLAVTAWSLLGACDWTSLLTEERGDYESGVWDIRSAPPRETALAPMLRDLAAGRKPAHPVLLQPGWWKGRAPDAPPMSCPLLITGATGTLGQAIAGACRLRNIPYRLTNRHELPLDDPAKAAELLDEVRPWAVVNAAGWVRVDDAEHDEAGCMAANFHGALTLARLCADRGIHFTTFSSDLVFDGLRESYVESDATAPLNVYGRSKAQADDALLDWNMPILIVRTAAFFSAHDPHNFAMHVVGALRDGGSAKVASDIVITPTFVPDLVRATLDLVVDGERGLWHLTGEEPLSWHGFAQAIAKGCNLPSDALIPVSGAEMDWAAQRPRSAALRSNRGRLLPPLDRAVRQFATDLGAYSI